METQSFVEYSVLPVPQALLPRIPSSTSPSIPCRLLLPLRPILPSLLLRNWLPVSPFFSECLSSPIVQTPNPPRVPFSPQDLDVPRQLPPFAFSSMVPLHSYPADISSMSALVSKGPPPLEVHTPHSTTLLIKAPLASFPHCFSTTTPVGSEYHYPNPQIVVVFVSLYFIPPPPPTNPPKPDLGFDCFESRPFQL